MSTPDRGPARRRRLAEQLQGRTPDESYTSRPSVRADLEAEAADPDPDALVSTEMLRHLDDLILARGGAAPGAPRVVIVPGLLGSALADAALGLLWPPPAGADRLGALGLDPYDGGEDDALPGLRVAVAGAVPVVYDLLRLALEGAGFAVEVLGFDWRKDLEVAARRLAARLRELAAISGEVSVVAHSQGALVARRAVQLLGPAESHWGVRHLVLLGPANFGSFAAALALAGRPGHLRLARRLGLEGGDAPPGVWSSMTGLYQLLPWDAARAPWLGRHDLGDPATWRGAIDAGRLARFHGWAATIDASFLDEHTAVILGDNHGAPTVGGLDLGGDVPRASAPHGLPGDGAVPHSLAVLPALRTYLAPGTEHSLLPADRRVIGAVLDLLEGRPAALPPLSTDPADHLPGGAAVRVAPACPAGVPVPPRASDPVAAAWDLNGTLLASRPDADPGPDAAAADDEQAWLRERDGRRPGNEVLRPQAAALAAAELTQPEVILDQSGLLPFHFLRTGDRLGRAVVKLERDDGAIATAFLVAPDILLTNHHVLPDPPTASRARALANYEAAPPDGPDGRPAAVALEPGRLFVTHAELDFTFCAVAGLDHLGCVPLARNNMIIMKNENVNIIQHPRGRHKEVALQGNQVVRADDVVLRYSCDTEPGSSGSPVFTNGWKLVALHHASVLTDEPGSRASPFGAPGARYLNEGIRLSAIALWLETADAEGQAGREPVARLRSIFRGVDPRVGFFGALGRRADGRSAAEVVAEAHRGGARDHLDVAYWDLHGLSRGLLEQLPDVGWVVADMGMDLWCLAHVTPHGARALCDYLETNFRLEYSLVVPDPTAHRPGGAILYRRSRSLAPRAPARAGDGPTVLDVRVASRRGAHAEVAVAVVPHGDHVEAAVALVRPGSAPDWLLIGEDAHLAPDAAAALAGTGVAVLAAAQGPDGSVVVLGGLGSRVDRIFVSPNLAQSPGFPPTGLLTVADDRELPPSCFRLGTRPPIAVRLRLGDAPEPSPSDTPPAPCPPPPSRSPPPPAPTWRRRSASSSSPSSPSSWPTPAAARRRGLDHHAPAN